MVGLELLCAYSKAEKAWWYYCSTRLSVVTRDVSVPSRCQYLYVHQLFPSNYIAVAATFLSRSPIARAKSFLRAFVKKHSTKTHKRLVFYLAVVDALGAYGFLRSLHEFYCIHLAHRRPIAMRGVKSYCVDVLLDASTELFHYCVIISLVYS